ncbi:hypothetical protein MmiAt1_13260 [Methanimicrococcus sp. At1]|uniref:ASCH domain-containing protein n=1 Tax=Methanimicrococcus hacksteinii TaxID=3028293 RepID=A0ABU3VQP1_9EURY|nr:hypothetical protein [Methanimicrococcus sp. At1]MDV0445732.1 hypothetical protein [Methanimicrococcus sp. At1]
MLLSINPEHVDKIMTGEKKFEFRKVRCRSDVDKIVIYATSPIMQVVGEVDILDIIEDRPDEVWNQTSAYAGISRKFYDDYYKGKEKAVAYKLGNVNKYEKSANLADFGIHSAPQSFIYL